MNKGTFPPRPHWWLLWFTILVFISLGLISSPADAQPSTPLFPCSGGKPTANGCPALPAGFDPAVGKDDYFDLFVESVCIDQPDSWWKKKLVHVEVTVKVGSVNKTIPVYGQRTTSQCHIGVANYPLLTSIPANNNRLSIASHIYRSDDQDGMQQILGFLVDQQKNTTLNTYAVAAVPYLTAIGDIATQIYKAFASHSQNFQDLKDMDLVPTGPLPTRFDLRDEYIVVYAGTTNLSDSDIYLDSTYNVHLVKDDSVVASGSTWIVFRLQKRQHRLDYPTRTWYTDWEKLVREVRNRSVDAPTVGKRITSENTLLNADDDYTNGDKDYYSVIFLKSQAEMVKYLNNMNASVTDYDSAITAASVIPDITGTSPAGVFVTAAGGPRPVVGQASLSFRLDPATLQKAIVPDLFLVQLRNLNTRTAVQ
jgi:hypothetical protein